MAYSWHRRVLMKARPDVDTSARCYLITPSRHGYSKVTLQPHLFLAKYQSFGNVTACASEYIEAIYQ